MTLTASRRRRPVSERFWAKVQKTQGCWLWTGALKDGYGKFGLRAGLVVFAHRWAYEQCVGEIRGGLWILHHCDNRACVRPDHLYAGTAEQNTADMLTRDRQGEHMRPGAKTHCKRGHDLAVHGRQVDKRPGRTGRECATCKRRYQRILARWRRRHPK